MQTFQFQTGAIKRIETQTDAALAARFNSKLVRLKVLLLPPCVLAILRFNSKLVRLKEDIELTWLRPDARFQFQTGAIKRWHTSLSVLAMRVFQFQTGAIKSWHIAV